MRVMQMIDVNWLSDKKFKFHHYRAPGHGNTPEAGAAAMVRQMDREKASTAKAAGEEGDQQRIAVAHSGDAVDDFDQSKYHYGAHPTLFPNGMLFYHLSCACTSSRLA